MLEPLGLTDDEEQAYLSLLRRPGQTRDQVAASLTSASKARVHKTLESLVGRGLATRRAGRPHRYSAIAPDIALTAITHEQFDRLRGVQGAIPELMEQYWRSQREESTLDIVEVLLGSPEELRFHVWQLIGHARHTVRAFERGPYMSQKRVPHPVEMEGLAQGIDFQVIYERDEIHDPERWRDLIVGIEAGEQARVYDGLPLKLIIIDDQIASTSLWTPDEEYLGTIVTHRSPLLDALIALFEAYWPRAVSVDVTEGVESPESGADGTDPLLTEIVRLLAAGHTDDAVARNLGISRSTVQRRVNELMAGLNVRTRFQLGLQLRELGDDGDHRRTA